MYILFLNTKKTGTLRGAEVQRAVWIVLRAACLGAGHTSLQDGVRHLAGTLLALCCSACRDGRFVHTWLDYMMLKRRVMSNGSEAEICGTWL